MLSKLLCLWAALLLCLPAHASLETPPRMRALLVGCDHFVTQPDTYPAADNNLQLLKEALAGDQRRYEDIVCLSDQVAAVSDMRKAVQDAFADALPGDVSLLYINTHGVMSDSSTVSSAGLILSNGREEEILTLPALEEMLRYVPGKKVLILDACNAGAFIGKGLSGGADRVYFTGPDYKVLCSAGGSEASWYYQGADEGGPAQGASYFVSVLADGLGVRGNCAADRNADGSVTLLEMYDYLVENYAASTPQVYPQCDDAFVLFSYDVNQDRPIQKAVTDLVFDEPLLTAGQTDVYFSFTVRRNVELFYQIIYHQDGRWQFDQAQQFRDMEQEDGTVAPGRKERTLSLNTGDEDAFGYAILQLITREGEKIELQGSRLLCVQPAEGQVQLNLLTDRAFVPGVGQELCILAQHDVPCGITVNVADQEGRVVRHLAYEQPTRPQQLIPNGSSFYWDGKTDAGDEAPAGLYTVRARVRLGVNHVFLAESSPVQLIDWKQLMQPGKEE